MRKLLYISMGLCILYLLSIPFLSSQFTYDEIIQWIPSYIQEPLEVQNRNACKKNLKIHLENDFCYYYTKDAMDVDEVFVIRCDKMQQKDIILKLEERIAHQKQKFDGYGIIQMEKLNQAKLLSFDDCVLMIISNDDDLLSLGGHL